MKTEYLVTIIGVVLTAAALFSAQIQGPSSNHLLQFDEFKQTYGRQYSES